MQPGPDEAGTRRLIDAQLRAAGWKADSEHFTYERGARPQAGRHQAIAEWPTAHGPADYVLFLGLEAVGVVEAKRWDTDVPGALQQARRYAEAFVPHLPFLYATNGRPYLEQLATKSGIWFHDIRRPSHLPRALTVAMATGTGKTRTCLGLLYRLVAAGRFRRVLFLERLRRTRDPRRARRQAPTHPQARRLSQCRGTPTRKQQADRPTWT
jgi:type I site-specific restriction endonuclease